jgi:hypothetical protein
MDRYALSEEREERPIPHEEPLTSATFPQSSTSITIQLLRQSAPRFRRELPHCRWSRALAEGGDAGLSHLVVLIHRASAHPYRADHLATCGRAIHHYL